MADHQAVVGDAIAMAMGPRAAADCVQDRPWSEEQIEATGHGQVRAAVPRQRSWAAKNAMRVKVFYS